MTESIQGLTEQEAQDRRRKGQGNAVQLQTGRSYWQILRANLFTFINTVLFGISAVLILLGLYVDAAMTAGLVLMNVLIGAYQESRAKRKLEKISLLTRPKAVVIRDSIEKEIDPSQIVLGDVLRIQAGDQVLADGQVIGDGTITVDESLLTGESEPVRKRRGDRLLSGSICTAGRAYYEAQGVGVESFANRLTAGARRFRQVKTPLQREIDRIVRILVFLVSLLGTLMAIDIILHGTPLTESARIAAVIVALVPQGLFFMTTIAYAMGAVRVASKGALIQQSSAIELTSHVDMLCLDKTGTLTTNRIRFDDLRLPTGTPDSDRQAVQRMLGEYAASVASGNRTTAALAEAFPAQERQVAEEAPFASERKWSGIVFCEPEGNSAYVLGAHEILAGSVQLEPELQEQGETWAREGRRVLLYARAPGIDSLHDPSGDPQLPGYLEAVCLVSFVDELRPEAEATLQRFKQLGIQPKIISGDNPETVAALAQQVGFPVGKRFVSGLELEALEEAQWESLAGQATIFGRITPQQKEKLVRLYRKMGHTVAMIGDGVNDVLSLKAAHVGVAMQSGSPAARGVADIVLLSDSFAALPYAFEEGQRIRSGMSDVIRLLLARTLFVLLLVVGAQLVGAPFPLTPKLNSVIALLTVGIPILAIAAWARPGPSSRWLLQSVSPFIFPAAFSVAFLSLFVYLAYLANGASIATARTALTFQLIVCGLLLIPFVEPPSPAWTGGDELSGDQRPSLLALALLGAFGLIMAVPGLRNSFELTPLRLTDYLWILGVGFGWALIIRLLWRRRWFERMLELGAE